MSVSYHTFHFQPFESKLEKDTISITFPAYSKEDDETIQELYTYTERNVGEVEKWYPEHVGFMRRMKNAFPDQFEGLLFIVNQILLHEHQLRLDESFISVMQDVVLSMRLFNHKYPMIHDAFKIKE